MLFIGSLFYSFTHFGRYSFIIFNDGEVKEARNEKTRNMEAA